MTQRIDFIEQREFGPEVLGESSRVPSLPLLAARYAAMTPPAQLAVHEIRACGQVMSWFSGPLALEGYRAGWFRSEDLTLYYVEGPDNGPPLLFYPGQVDPWHSYLPVLGALSARFHVYLMEHRGHGFSERSVPGEYRVVDYTRDAIQFIEHVIGEPCFITGHSLGGMMGMATWDLRPDLVRGLSLEDPPFFIMDAESYAAGWIEKAMWESVRTRSRALQDDGLSLVRAQRHAAAAPMALPPKSALPERGQRAKFVAWVMERKDLASQLALLPAADEAFYRSAFDRYVQSGEVCRTADYLPFVFLEPLEDAWVYTDWRTSISHLGGKWIAGCDERRALASLSVPVIFWISDRDVAPIRTEAQCDEVRSLLAQGNDAWDFIEVENAGHYIHKEEPVLFADRVVSTFL